MILVGMIIAGASVAQQSVPFSMGGQKKGAAQPKPPPSVAAQPTQQPSPAAVHFMKAISLHKAGKIDQAIPEYKATIKADPRIMPAYMNLAMIYMSKGNLKDAEGLQTGAQVWLACVAWSRATSRSVNSDHHCWLRGVTCATIASRTALAC